MPKSKIKGWWRRVKVPWWVTTSESKQHHTRLTTRLCPKCGKWIALKTKRHGCDVPRSPKKWRWCAECQTYVRLSVRHKCDREPVIPDDVPEKECRACGESWPLTRDFWNTRGKEGGWRPECRECRNGRRRALKAGAPPGQAVGRGPLPVAYGAKEAPHVTPRTPRATLPGCSEDGPFATPTARRT